MLVLLLRCSKLVVELDFMINKVAVIGHDKTFFSFIGKNLLRTHPEMVCVARKFGVQNRHNLTLFCIRMRLTKFSTVNAINTQNMFYH